MLRDPSLIPLSHQHHNGLALGVLVKRSLAADSGRENVGALARRAIDRYELELVNHFEMEEQILFPACGPMPLIEELIAQHRQLEDMIVELRVTPSVKLLEDFCGLLATHIRLEENQLFEAAQRTIPREELDEIGAQIDRRAVRICL